MKAPRKSRRLVLVGAGHAHIEVLRRFALAPDPETELVLVSELYEAAYSGMIPGFVAGLYSWKDLTMDVAALAARAGAVFVCDPVTRLAPPTRELYLRGVPLHYDVLSLDIGSRTALPPMDEGLRSVNGPVMATRPFWEIRQQLSAWERRVRPGQTLAVLGSGPAGFELACAFRTRFPALAVTLLLGHNGATRLQKRALAERGIAVADPGAVSLVTAQGEGVLARGAETRLPFDYLVCATGAKAHPLVAASGLPHAHGYLRVNEQLQCLSDPRVFGAGDCVHFVPRKGLAKSGVYAVRAGPVLHANLLAALRGENLQPWRPQRRFLRLLNASDGTALAEWGPFSLRGKWAWRWKDRIDRRFLSMYKMEMPPMAEPDCGGCGSKAAADVVCELRAPGEQERSRKVVWGTREAEDVALWEIGPGQRTAATVDQFRNFGADPYLFGRIAAVAAASDLYAKGIPPEAALMTLQLPRLTSALARDWAKQLRAGVDSVFGPEKIELLGGHTTEGEEWSVGFSLWGEVTRPLWSKRGVQAGDALLLTKPLGTGILLAAHMQGVHLAGALSECYRGMAISQRVTWEALASAPVHACTDVTGFSLLGHLSEMIDGTGLGAELHFSRIPFLPEAKEAFARGYRSRMHELNQRSFPVTGLTAGQGILYDPQTSGGLLVAVPSAAAAGIPFPVIGRITSVPKIRVLP